MQKVRIIKDLSVEISGVPGDLSKYIGKEFEIIELEEYGTIWFNVDGEVEGAFLGEYELVD